MQIERSRHTMFWYYFKSTCSRFEGRHKNREPANIDSACGVCASASDFPTMFLLVKHSRCRESSKIRNNIHIIALRGCIRLGRGHKVDRRREHNILFKIISGC